MALIVVAISLYFASASVALWLQWCASVVWTDGLWLLSALSLTASSRRNGNDTRRRHVAAFAAVDVLLSVVWEWYRSQRSTTVTTVVFLVRGLGGHYFASAAVFVAIHRMTFTGRAAPPTRAKKAVAVAVALVTPFLLQELCMYGVGAPCLSCPT